MEITGWKYYNHAAIPTVLPHEDADLVPIFNGDIWKLYGGTPIIARWTTDFDCGYKTDWWYIIKDTPFDINTIKAKRRYEIKKGCENFEVLLLRKPTEYFCDILNVQRKAFLAYPEKYRPTVDDTTFLRQVEGWEKNNNTVYGAFDKKNGKLCGYAHLSREKTAIHFNVLKTIPEYERYGVNAAIVYRIIQDANELLSKGEGYYICDGSRNILHETAFQDYLCKYFEFRKAYCKICVKYNPKFKLPIIFLYKLRRILKLVDGISIVHKVNGILLMHGIAEIK